MKLYAVYTIYPPQVWTIPLGFPVDPEVYKINNTSSESIISGAHTDDKPSIKSCHHKSIDLFQLTDSNVCCNTTHFLIVSQDFNASSAMSLRGIVLSPLKPPSAVIKKLEPESWILAASAEAEKPAKTTEWMAPILAQARTAMVNSGTIGKYRHTRSPLDTPMFLSPLANLQTDSSNSL